MYKTISNLFIGATLLVGFNLNSYANEFPNPEIYAPVKGVSSFNTISIIWNYETLEEGESANRMVSILTPSGVEVTSRGFTEYVKPNDSGGSMDSSDAVGENSLTVSFYNALLSNNIGENGSFNEPGLYLISILEGAVFIDGIPNPPVSLQYTLGDLPEMEPATFNFSYENEIPLLLISWNNQTLSPTRAASNGLGASLFFDNDEDELYIMGPAFSLLEDNTVLQINLNGMIFEEGNYKLVFPGGQLENENGEVNPRQTFDFLFVNNGVQIINSDNRTEIFDLNGHKIQVTDTSDGIINLSPGIYIINGRKILVK